MNQQLTTSDIALGLEASEMITFDYAKTMVRRTANALGLGYYKGKKYSSVEANQILLAASEDINL